MGPYAEIAGQEGWAVNLLTDRVDVEDKTRSARSRQVASMALPSVRPFATRGCGAGHQMASVILLRPEPKIARSGQTVRDTALKLKTT